MKLIYLHQYFKFPNEQGGTRSYDLAKCFAEAGHKPIILTTTSNKNIARGNRWSIIERDGLEIHYVYIPYGNDLSYPKRIWAFLKFVFFATYRLLSIKCDVVLATSTPLTIGIPALIKKKLSNTPYIFEVRDVWPEAVIAIGAIKNKHIQRLLFLLEKIIYKNSDSIVPLSLDMKNSIINRIPEVAEKIHHIIPNIAELTRFQNYKGHIDLKEKIGFQPRFTVLYAGTFGRANGLHKLVELASLTKNLDPSLCYILIGDGALKKNITQQAKDVGVLNTNLFIFDPIAKDDLPVWYASVSMGSSFVIPIRELWANSANKFFDTLAAKKPILINHEGWQAETIRSKNVGYVLPSEMTEQAATDFVSYTNDTSMFNIQCSNAINLAKNEYSLEVASYRYQDIFRAIQYHNNC